MADRPDPTTMINEIKSDVVVIGKDLYALAKAEAKPRAVDAAVLGGSFGAAAYLAACGAALLFLGGAAGFAALFSLWLGPYGAVALGLVAMAVVLFVIALVLALVGKSWWPRLKRPLQTVDAATGTAKELKSSLGRGQQMVAAEIEASKQPALSPREQ
ncbi:MAG: phage holin family protein [Actinomycetia bacterium]|nr:phage holin family protein [Actinomycetes bacterium]